MFVFWIDFRLMSVLCLDTGKQPLVQTKRDSVEEILTHQVNSPDRMEVRAGLVGVVEKHLCIRKCIYSLALWAWIDSLAPEFRAWSETA